MPERMSERNPRHQTPTSPVIWEMLGRGLRVSGELHPHPLGVEVRIVADGELQRSQVHASRAEALRDLDETREWLTAHGFSEVGS